MGKWYDLLPQGIFGEEQKKQSAVGTPIGYTGLGKDGIFQKNNPTNIVQTKNGPLVLHEGEATVQNPNGSVTVVPQKQLSAIAKNMPGMAEGGTFDPANNTQNPLQQTTPQQPTSQQDVNTGMGIMRDVASGKAPMTESIYNRTMSEFGGAQQAAIGAAKQEAAQAGYGKEAIGSIAQTAMRGMEGERSKLMGEIAGQTQAQQLGAAERLISAGQTERAYTDSQKEAEWNRTLLYTDPSTPEGLKALQDAYSKLYGGNAPDFNTLQEERNFLRTQRGQQIESGRLNIDAQQLQNDAQRFSLNKNQMEALVYMANNGFDLATVNGILGTSIGTNEYTQLQRDYMYAGQLQDISKMSAETQLNILKGSVSKDMYDQLEKRILDGVPLDEIRKMDFNGDGTPDFPNLTQTAYDGMMREKNIALATAQYKLDAARMEMGYTKWNQATQMAKAGYSSAQINEALGTTFNDDDVKNLRESISTQTPEQAFTEALLYNDPATAEGLAAIKQAWVDAHPGKTIDDAPDFNTLIEQRTAAQAEARITEVTNAGKVSGMLIADIVENTTVDMGGWTDAQVASSQAVQDALKNETLRKSIASILGVEDTGTGSVAIDSEITKRLQNAYRGDVDTIVSDFVKAGRVPTEFMDTPDYQGQLKRAIQDMLNEGVIDSEGNLIEGKLFEWPWNSPNTYFNYTDWNGKDISYSAAGDRPSNYGATQVDIEGNGTTYGKMVGGTLTPVNFTDMETRWNSLSLSEKEKYFTDGTFDRKKFMQENFGAARGTGGNQVFTTTAQITDYLTSNEDVLNEIYANIAGGTDAQGKVLAPFISAGKYPAGNQFEGQSLSANNEFQYYGDDGQWHSTSTLGSGMLGDIWLQFSQYFNNGEVLTAQQFMQYWNDGQGWVVNDDGIVLNFNRANNLGGTFNESNPALSSGDFKTYIDNKRMEDMYGLSAEAFQALTEGFRQGNVFGATGGWLDINNTDQRGITDIWNRLKSTYDVDITLEDFKQMWRTMGWANKNAGKSYAIEDGKLRFI